jgi:DNA-binding MarR family transcriptional regulator
MLLNMPSSSRNKTALARAAWKLMFDLLMRSAPERTKILGDRGLTPNDARAMSSLDPEKGRTMRSLADEWSCDASNATWIVDRLEQMELAERRTIPEDRRVKLVALTRKGLKLRTQMLEKFYKPPSDLLVLAPGDLEMLERILQRTVPRREKSGTSSTAELIRRER